jgi:hypothetical protein
VATFAVIEARKAPARTKAAGRWRERMAQYEGFLAGVKKGQVGTLTPDANETVRGVAVRISRAGKRVGTAVDAWAVDGVVYFKVS